MVSVELSVLVLWCTLSAVIIGSAALFRGHARTATVASCTALGLALWSATSRVVWLVRLHLFPQLVFGPARPELLTAMQVDIAPYWWWRLIRAVAIVFLAGSLLSLARRGVRSARQGGLIVAVVLGAVALLIAVAFVGCLYWAPNVLSYPWGRHYIGSDPSALLNVAAPQAWTQLAYTALLLGTAIWSLVLARRRARPTSSPDRPA